MREGSSPSYLKGFVLLIEAVTAIYLKIIMCYRFDSYAAIFDLVASSTGRAIINFKPLSYFKE